MTRLVLALLFILMNRCFIEAEHYRIIEAMLDKFKEYLRGEEPGFLDDAPTDK